MYQPLDYEFTKLLMIGAGIKRKGNDKLLSLGKASDMSLVLFVCSDC